MGAAAAKPEPPPPPPTPPPPAPRVSSGGDVDLEHVRWVLANIMDGRDGPDRHSGRWWQSPDVASTAQARKLWRLTLGAGAETNLGHFHFTNYMDIRRQTDGEPVFALACAVLARHRHPFEHEGPNLDYSTPFSFVHRAWMPHLTWAGSVSPENQPEAEQLVQEALVSWNTAKAIVLLATLKNNNVGPILRDKATSARSYAGPWQTVFPGDVRDDAWGELMAVYNDYYHRRLGRPSSGPILASPHQRRQVMTRFVVFRLAGLRNPHLPQLPTEVYDYIAGEFLR